MARKSDRYLLISNKLHAPLSPVPTEIKQQSSGVSSLGHKALSIWISTESLYLQEPGVVFQAPQGTFIPLSADCFSVCTQVWTYKKHNQSDYHVILRSMSMLNAFMVCYSDITTAHCRCSSLYILKSFSKWWFKIIFHLTPISNVGSIHYISNKNHEPHLHL